MNFKDFMTAIGCLVRSFGKEEYTPDLISILYREFGFLSVERLRRGAEELLGNSKNRYDVPKLSQFRVEFASELRNQARVLKEQEPLCEYCLGGGVVSFFVSQGESRDYACFCKKGEHYPFPRLSGEPEFEALLKKQSEVLGSVSAKKVLRDVDRFSENLRMVR